MICYIPLENLFRSSVKMSFSSKKWKELYLKLFNTYITKKLWAQEML